MDKPGKREEAATEEKHELLELYLVKRGTPFTSRADDWLAGFDSGRESRSADYDMLAGHCADLTNHAHTNDELEAKLAEQAAEIARLKQVLIVSKLAIEALAESLKDEGMGLVGACIVVPATLRKIDEALAPQASEKK